jgi:hypothetical protein
MVEVDLRVWQRRPVGDEGRTWLWWRGSLVCSLILTQANRHSPREGWDQSPVPQQLGEGRCLLACCAIGCRGANPESFASGALSGFSESSPLHEVTALPTTFHSDSTLSARSLKGDKVAVYDTVYGRDPEDPCCVRVRGLVGVSCRLCRSQASLARSGRAAIAQWWFRSMRRKQRSWGAGVPAELGPGAQGACGAAGVKRNALTWAKAFEAGSFSAAAPELPRYAGSGGTTLWAMRPCRPAYSRARILASLTAVSGRLLDLESGGAVPVGFAGRTCGVWSWCCGCRGVGGCGGGVWGCGWGVVGGAGAGAWGGVGGGG